MDRDETGSSPRASELRRKFRSLFGDEPRIFRAPGRVNLIGDHTDYNDGFVLPMAVDLYVWVAIAPRTDARLVVHSINFNQTIQLALEDLSVHSERTWSDYVRGVAYFLSRAAPGLRGANLLLHGEVPMGAGLSSSAACGVGVGYSLEQISGIPVDLLRLAKIGQRAEHEFAGTRCGIMDQLICCCADANSALFLDCRSLEYEAVPLFPDASLVVCDSRVKHSHAASGYNARRSDCESGVRLLAERIPGVRALRDVSLGDLERWGRELPETIYKRCRHVVAENARVLEAVSAMRDGDAGRFGSLMYQSHRSLREDFEVSCAELDLLVDLAAACDGVHGSRMTGGGFGGSTVSLVQRDRTAGFVDRVSEGFEERTGSAPEIHVFKAAGGVEEVRDG